MDLKTALALLETDETGPESLPGIAAQALEEGTNSRSLRLLAGISPFDPRDARDLFNRAMVELGISMQPPAAAIIAAQWVAAQCLNGALSSQDASERIWRIDMWITNHPGHSRSKELQILAEAAQFAEYFQTPELRSAYGARDQIERDVIAVLRRLVATDEALGARSADLGIEVPTVRISSHLDRSTDVPAAERLHAGSLRPAFVWVLAIILVPMLFLFGFGFLNDIRSPWRFVIASAYAVGAFVAPIILIRRSARIGIPRTIAIAGGLLIALIVLFADLYVFTANVGEYGAALAVAVAAGAVAFAALWKPPVPPSTAPSMQGGKSVSRADRIGGAIGALVWASLAIWMALAPFSLGWKLLFELVYVAGAVDYVFLFLGRPRVIDSILSFLRGRGRTRN